MIDFLGSGGAPIIFAAFGMSIHHSALLSIKLQLGRGPASFHSAVVQAESHIPGLQYKNQAIDKTVIVNAHKEKACKRLCVVQYPVWYRRV